MRSLFAVSARAVGPVLVACDGSPFLGGLLGAAHRAAEALGTSLEVVTVCEPTPLAPIAGAMTPSPPVVDVERCGQLLADVRRLVTLEDTGAAPLSTEVLLGTPAAVLPEEAERRGAPLLVMGVGRHNPLDRLLGSETTLAALRRSRVPILAVGIEFPAHPRHVVVGVDFSSASLRAAKLAVRLIGEGARVSLVHVRPRFAQASAAWRAWDREYTNSLTSLFEAFVRDLAAPADCVVETHTVRGDPAPALLAFAAQSEADCLAVGAQRHVALERLLVGSVATRILRSTRIAVLAAPPPLVAGVQGLAPEGARIESSQEPAAWGPMLAEFTRTNAGRGAMLEVGSSDAALSAIVGTARLRSVSCDVDPTRIHIALAADDAEQTSGAHHAHDVIGVRQLSIVRDAAGHDLGLHCRHDGAVTRLTLAPAD